MAENDDKERLIPSREVHITDRLTRVEERLIAEKSVRKTRDDQLFKFISGVHEDLVKQESSLAEISSEMGEVRDSVRDLVNAKDVQKETLDKLMSEGEVNKAALYQITGSIKTMKFVVPLIITIIGAAITLLLTSIDSRIKDTQQDQAIEKTQQQQTTDSEEGVE